MEPILTLDLVDSPAKIRVVSYEDEKLTVLSESTVDLFLKAEALVATHSSDSSAQETKTENTQSETVESEYSPGHDPVNNESAPPEAVAPLAIKPDASSYFVSQLSAAIEQLEPSWGSSALLVAPKSYHSLNIELPFRDDKNVAKVLSLEAQDRLPFDVDEFFLEHKILGARPDSQFDVHVALTRKEELGELLSNCQRAGLDPMAISTVSSLLEGRTLSNPGDFSDNCVFVVFHGDYAHLAFRIEGKFTSDRAFKYQAQLLHDLVSEVRRTIGSVESRYSVSFSELWLDSSEFKNTDHSATPASIQQTSIDSALKEALNIPIKILSKESDQAAATLTNWFATLCSDGKASKLFVNFRSGQFSQTLRWGALWKIASPALPYFLMLLVGSIAILIATYSIRAQEISNLQEGVIAKVQPLLGDTKLVPGNIVKSIQVANDTIEKQLKDLGSPSKFSPLDVLSEVTKDFSSIKDVTITAVNIRGTQLTVTGSSNNYENVDAIEKVLQSKRTLYCRPSKQVTGTTVRQFTFTVVLCD